MSVVVVYILLSFYTDSDGPSMILKIHDGSRLDDAPVEGINLMRHHAMLPPTAATGPVVLSFSGHDQGFLRH